MGTMNVRTLIVLPSAREKEQKIVIGDDRGTVTCFKAKRGMIEV